MGFLDGLIGGVIGAEMATVVNRVIADHGGVSGLVSKFEQGGLGSIMQSWVGTGANAPISPDQIHQLLGPDLLQKLAGKTGLSTADLAHKLSQVLPDIVDKFTPGGVIPKS